uniref:RING-type domain-containing protein n=1 Tax=Sphaeramia orbicularis TaxID=375764 RepID=A0A673B7L4_9TELE
MAAAGFLLSEDHCLCSICLDVFTDPVSTPCGHNFCKNCINQNWDKNVPYKCPNCKETFSVRPNLKVNTFISEISAQFRQSAQQKGNSSSKQQVYSRKKAEMFVWIKMLSGQTLPWFKYNNINSI